MLNPADSAKLPADSNAILSYLTTRQHVRPHAPIQSILEETIEHFACCPLAVAKSVQWLNIDPLRPIGRLRRGEIMQLARSIHRFWVQNTKLASGVI